MQRQPRSAVSIYVIEEEEPFAINELKPKKIMKKIRGCGSLKFEDLGQGGQRYALSGSIIDNDWPLVVVVW